MQKTCVILSYPRSGTNYLMDALKQFSNTRVYSEVYHNKRSYLHIPTISRYLPSIKNEEFKDCLQDETKLCDFVHKHPDITLEEMQNTCDQEYLFFKIFPNHLTQQQLDKHILKQSSILKVIIQRNPLHIFISLQKAQITNKWDNYDTSKMKITIDTHKFHKFYLEYIQWFQDLREHIQNPYLILNYEEIHSHTSDSEKLVYLQSQFKKFNICLKPSNNSMSLRVKQDSSTLSNKIENMDKLIKFLSQNNLSHLLF